MLVEIFKICYNNVTGQPKGKCKGGWHMRPKKIIAMVMTFLMMLSLLPSLVFASAVPEGELGGKLKIKGTAAVGSEQIGRAHV